MSEPPVARLDRVSHRYGDAVALDDVSLALPARGIVGLIGPDGVGKSTLLGLVSGTRHVQAGRVVTLEGDMHVGRDRRAVCPRVAYLPQGLGGNLYPDLSVGENLDFFARLFGQARAERARRAAVLLAATGLGPFRDRHVRNLSGGMKQKLGLCCALIHDPDLLVLDEPTTGVDPLSRRQFWELLDRIRERRPEMSVIVSTAYMDEAERLDWLIVMHAGRVLATGTPGEIEARTAAPDLEAAFVALLPGAERGGHRRVRIPPRTARADGAAIEARALTKRFGAFTAVDDVSFHIERGEIFGFVGSNGCGKTTTMKVLTGLLPATAGEARLFGRVLDARDMDTRRRVGFMSQSFSLYGELTVHQNLELHARLFQVPAARVPERVDEMVARFGLASVVDARAETLPLGIRQRLSLAVALIHEPSVLILDEPTSGVDPVARDRFWAHLVRLSRDDGVTVFLSTHFMNEAARCDRVALMHAGRVLAVDGPEALARSRGCTSLEEAFVAYLRGAEGVPPPPEAPDSLAPGRRRRHPSLDPRRLWAYAAREGREMLRDHIRLAFALLGPIVLLIVFGYGMSFDVEHVSVAVLDRDHTPASRRYVDAFAGSRWFALEPPLTDAEDLDRRLRAGHLQVAIEIPPDFGRDLERGSRPDVGVWLDGAMPFKAETASGYVAGAHDHAVDRWWREQQGRDPPEAPATVETRLRYNPEFESVFAIVPGVVMLILVLIPAVMTAVGVVREKETGSIVNLYVTPVTRLEFLLGKQLPYVAVGFLSALVLVALAVTVFGVRVTGSLPALLLGALLYVTATTGLGLVVSTFVRTQLAAIFATAIITTLPATQFSGLLTPIASLTGSARVMGAAFPCGWFQQVSLGTFAKGLRMGDLVQPYLALAGFALVYLLAARALLHKQAR